MSKENYKAELVETFVGGNEYEPVETFVGGNEYKPTEYELVETFVGGNECKPTEYELSEIMKKSIAKDKEVRRYKAMDALEKMGYNAKEITDVLGIIKTIFISDETLTGAEVKKALDTFRYFYVIWNS